MYDKANEGYKVGEAGWRSNLVLAALKNLEQDLVGNDDGAHEILLEYVVDAKIEDLTALADLIAQHAGTPTDPLTNLENKD